VRRPIGKRGIKLAQFWASGVTVFVVLSGAEVARATLAPAVSTRLSLGGGGHIPPGDARGGLFELAPRLEALWGKDTAAGPGIELRTSNFSTTELTGGATGVLSNGDLGAMATLGGGYAWRRNGANGALISATVGCGVVHVDVPWASTTTVYLALRHSVTGPSSDELTAGLSFGGGLLDAVFRIARGD